MSDVSIVVTCGRVLAEYILEALSSETSDILEKMDAKQEVLTAAMGRVIEMTERLRRVRKDTTHEDGEKGKVKPCIVDIVFRSLL